MTIEEFAAAVTESEKERHIATYGDVALKDHWAEASYNTTIKPGKKYTKVDVGHSGRYMIVNDTGEIFGIKGYGVIHRGHYYGNINDSETVNPHWSYFTGKIGSHALA